MQLRFADADIRAQVVEDRLAGDIVVLSCSGGLVLDRERHEKVAAALSGFAVQFRWAEDAGAMVDNESEQRRDSVAELRSLHRAAEFRA